MNTQLFDPLTDRALRSLDTADTTPDPVTRARAEDTLERILATPTVGSPASGRAPRRRRWLVPVAAAGVAGVVAVPILVNSSGPAYATWTAKPGPVASADLTRAGDACRKQLEQMEKEGQSLPPETRPIVKADTAKVVLAERRGEYVFVALATDSGAELSCLSDADRPGRVTSAGGSVPTAAAEPVTVARDNVSTGGSGVSGGPEGSVMTLQGLAGADVAAVTLRTEGRVIEATVSDGHFAAWWPSGPITAEPVVLPPVQIDVTLTSGKVVTDVAAEGPQAAMPGPREIGRVERGRGVGPDGEVGTSGGYVGSDVTGVVVHADGIDTTAEVADGTFRAQWKLPAGAGDMEAATYTLTLRDGTVLSHVKPVSGADS